MGQPDLMPFYRRWGSALLGSLGGALFADRPLVGRALSWAGALAISGPAVAANRVSGCYSTRIRS